MILILKQAHRLPGNFERKIEMLRRSPDFGVESFVNKRMIEQTEQKLQSQHARNGLVKSRHGNPAILCAIDNRALKHRVAEIEKLHIDPGV